MAERAIHTQLSGVGALGGRVYPQVLPQNVTYPAATYQRITSTAAVVRPSGAMPSRWRPPSRWTCTQPRAKATKNSTPLSSQSGRSFRGSARRAQTAPSTCFLDSERDDYEDDTKLYRKSFDVRVWYREA